MSPPLSKPRADRTAETARVAGAIAIVATRTPVVFVEQVVHGEIEGVLAPRVVHLRIEHGVGGHREILVRRSKLLVAVLHAESAAESFPPPLRHAILRKKREAVLRCAAERFANQSRAQIPHHAAVRVAIAAEKR